MDADAGGWRPMWRLEITAGLGGAWTILGLALLVATTVGVVALAGALHPDLGRISALVVAVAVLLSIPVTLVLHEAVHGLAFLAFGGRPRFGGGIRAGTPYLYAACPQQRFPRDRFLVVGMAPLVVLGLAGLALMLAAGSTAFGASMVVVNTSGAIGDLWMTAVLLQVPRWMHVEDTGGAILAWAPPAHAAEAAHRRAPMGLDVPLMRWVGPWVLTTVVLTGPLTYVLLEVSTRRQSGEIRLGPFLLARTFDHGREISLGAPLLLSALLAALIVPTATVGRRLWRRRRQS